MAALPTSKVTETSESKDGLGLVQNVGLWPTFRDSLTFQSVPVVSINEWRLGLADLLLKVALIAYILVDFFVLCSHLEIQTSAANVVFLAVTDLTNMNFNATPANRNCSQLLVHEGAVPFNGAGHFSTFENVRLHSIPGEGYARHSDTSLTVNTLVEKEAETSLSSWSGCGFLEHGGSCQSVTQSTPYEEVFGRILGARSDAVCVQDWERYVVMVSSSLEDREGNKRKMSKFWMQTKKDGDWELNEIDSSRTADDVNDWINEALPAVRQHKPFRSRYWNYTYLSVPALLRAAEAEDFKFSEGVTLQIELHFTNVGLFKINGGSDLDMIIKVRRLKFLPFRERHVGPSHVAIAWHKGIKITVQTTVMIRSWSTAKFGILMVSYFSYLLISASVIRFFLLYGDWPGLRYVTRCLCFCMQGGRLHRAGASSTWYRSLLVRNSPEITSDQYSSVILDVDKDEKVGIKVDQSTFKITHISANSAMSLYNYSHQKRQVAVGDTIVQINGYTRDTPMLCMQELYSPGIIEMTIRHVYKVDDDSDVEKGLIDNLSEASEATPSWTRHTSDPDLKATCDVPGTMNGA